MGNRFQCFNGVFSTTYKNFQYFQLNDLQAQPPLDLHCFHLTRLNPLNTFKLYLLTLKELFLDHYIHIISQYQVTNAGIQSNILKRQQEQTTF